MPARTLSQLPSTSSPVTSGEICYICGLESKFIFNVFAKPVPNCPYFPSLMMHPKPVNAKPMDNSGKVSACDMCHKSLIQQWDSYQRQNVPHHERAYQCKSLTTSVKQEIRMKDKLFVCYTCGMITQLSAQRFINAYPEKEGDPFFSFLLNVNPHPGANKLVGGKASVCSLCYKTLFRQLRVYKLSDTPEEKRKYKIVNESASDSSSMLRQHLKSSKNRNEEKFACYLCELISESLILVNTLPVGDIYFPFIRSLPQPSNAGPVDSQGCVKICKQCHISLTYQWEAFERAFIPINQRQYKIPGSKLPNVEIKPVINSIQQSNSVDPSSSSSINTSNQDEYALKFVSSSNVCSLCECPLNSENVCFIETVPQEKNMYFPSLRLLIKPNNRKNIDQYGRILGCNQCYLILKNQWEVFESAHVPHSQRQYEIFSSSLEREQGAQFTNNVCLSNASAALHIQVSSPDIKVDLSKHSSNVEPLLTTVNTLTVSSVTETSASMLTSDNSPNDIKTLSGKLPCNPEETVPRICGPLDIPYVRPLFLMQINCFVCGEPNSSGLTYAIRSGPIVMSNIDKVSEEVPFFPFLTKHPLPEGAERLSNDGNALVCMFCYHSLISQWLAYESSPYQEDANPWHRRYNTHNYVCYICGITTYRKRVCSISVKDFPFLLEHTRPSGALTLLNGECVVTCQTCFESIISQWKDFERMKVPVEMRKYNWIVLPPPPDDENSKGCQIL
ncbi:uncharacterized protein LOC118179779, partial [Stegodyphus dumicola]|uniref:uncharacterized protein LOC118179779 n=1 Tax=Stegodyphus dumicola TaxID=202533 RepID=UPI0015B02964